jgi:hypothetical protein
MDSHKVIHLSSHESRHRSGELSEEYQRLSRRVNRRRNQREVCSFPAERFGRICGFVGFGRSHATDFTG